MANGIGFYKNGYNGVIKVSDKQKVLQIHRQKKTVCFEAHYKALQNLTTDAFALYSYLVMLPLDKPWALSSKDVTERTALSMRTYNNAVHELIDKGYMTPGDIKIKNFEWQKNAYHLWEDPEDNPDKEESEA